MNYLNKKRYVVSMGLLLAALGSNNSTAGAMGEIAPSYNWVGSLSLGPVWQSGGKARQFYLTSDIEKTFAPGSRSKEALADGEVFLGIQRNLTETFQGQLGLALAATNYAKFSGESWDDADPLFNNHGYSYKLQHSYVGLKGKLLADMGYFVTPWVSGSAGVGFNHASDFTNWPTIYAARITPDFSDHTKATFSYTLGAGVQRIVDQHWQVGVGYEFSDWGKSGLSRAPGQVLNTGLTLNHLYTNGFLFNLTYVV